MPDSFVTLWTVAHLAPLWDSSDRKMGVGCHSLSPGDLPDPEIECRSPALQADALSSEPPGITVEGVCKIKFMSATHSVVDQ